ncbi:hypothetical protein AALO_G00092150 [Alosa alosa]|uniref:Uncharacterized protein n=1 Tax=Alosa alosa TaxID=278164 RepID=A0AAV6GRS4_9TELE|nr:hypothetical protein AALO_G00092150 [Alosa alosa]
MDLGLQLSSGCNVNDAETLQVDLLVKEENLKEEEYGRMISCQDEEEKPFGEFHCNVKSETDNSEYNVTYYETRHTEVKEEEEQEVELKAELDEQENDDQLECSSETFQAPVEIEVKKEEEEHLLENAPAEAEDDTEGDLLAEDETPPRTRQKKESKKKLVNKERRMKGKSYTGKHRNEELLKEPRLIGPRCTSVACEKSSKHHCSEITEADRDKIFKNFWENMTWEEKRMYVCSLVDVVAVQRRTGSDTSRRSSTLVFFLKVREGQRMRVCKSLFLSTIGIGEWSALNWVKETQRACFCQQ